MEKFLRPERLDVNPDSSQASREWSHWRRTFENFLSAVDTLSPNKLNMLINYVSPSVFQYITDCDNYDNAMKILEELYIKPKNEVFARHLLATRKQEDGETLDQFFQSLKQLSKDCNYKVVTAELYRDESIRDAFISGIKSSHIRQRLLENRILSLQSAFDQARALEMAQRQSDSYSIPGLSTTAAATDHIQESAEQNTIVVNKNNLAAISSAKEKCYFCGYNRHSRAVCPARNAVCTRCQKKGHYVRVCKSTVAAALESTPYIASITAASPKCLSRAIVSAFVNKKHVQALIDTGSSRSFINDSVVRKQKLEVHSRKEKVTMASTAVTSEVQGYCVVDLELSGFKYPQAHLQVLDQLCSDIILGHDILGLHSQVEIPFGGNKPPLTVCGLTTMSVTPSSLFANLLPDCKPIAIKSRRHSSHDKEFIRAEVQRLLADGVIEPSNSPWRAQVLITHNSNHKKRMVIDYSQTINRFTLLDAYPLPRITEMIENIAQFRIFSTVDLKSAYHQIPICETDKPYTAFEADNQLYQFCRIPFGVTNGVSCFQRKIDEIIKSENLENTYAYIDNVTICGKTQVEHDNNLRRFMEIVRKYNLVLNEEKSIYSTSSVDILGYTIRDGEIRPDAERLRPLLELPAPVNTKSLRSVLGMFAHYSKWIPRFSEKIQPLVQCKTFPLPPAVEVLFENIKVDIANSVIRAVDETIPFVIETDASDYAIAATLCQAGRPVAFFSRTLSSTERKHAAVEKEAYAIVEAIRKWKHFLLGHHFQLITDQKSVAFMFDSKHKSKIKNDKIMRWRIELSCYSYEIVYRPGNENAAADAFSRIYCSAVSTNTLVDLHNSLCHPGVTRLIHFVRSRNLPFSVEDVRRTTRACSTCAEIKPRCSSPPTGKLIKATQPFERLNVDFKGPLPSASANKYMLTIVDEYSRFPFVFPCSDLTADTVIKCFCQLFAIFGTPSYIHSDLGSAFISSKLKTFLQNHGIATSHSTRYNPQGNGQVERYNGIIWKAVTLALKSRNLPVIQWEVVLADALHSVRSLLCTTTNMTPHERLFAYQRRSTNGLSVPSWLIPHSMVLMKRHVRQSKYDPLMEEVEVLDVNPQYAQVRMANGQETAVSLRHLAPSGDAPINNDYVPQEQLINNDALQYDASLPGTSNRHAANQPSVEDHSNATTKKTIGVNVSSSESQDIPPSRALEDIPTPTGPRPLRRSERKKSQPKHLQDYHLDI